MQRLIDGWIEREIPASDLLVDDGAQFQSPGICGELTALIANLIRKTQSHRPMPFRRDGNTRPDVVAYPVPSAARTCTGKDVKAGLKPVIPALGDFDGLM